jgi:nucleotide-binding universal stress UspA family protein
MYKTVVLAYDGSEAGQKALLDCREIVQWSQAELRLIAVMPRPVTSVAAECWVYTQEADVAQRELHQAVLDSGLQRLREAGLTAEGELVQGDSVEEIARCAARIGADLIVVGHKHLDRWTDRWWRGSVSKALIEQAPCSVLVAITR